jgi:D-serine deaminase-like pyridoxal phosphate-dependent protein
MGYLDLVERPTLLVDRRKVERNIERMARRAGEQGVSLRPHFKTHQSAEVGEWFRPYGVTGITVSSVDMAVGFAEAGWRDIVIAFPVNLRQMGTINQLAGQVKLGLLVESAETARRLEQLLTAEVNVWLKIDAGYGRTGIHWTDRDKLLETAKAVADSPHQKLTGILTHSGQTYGADSTDGAQRIFQESVGLMNAVRSLLAEHGFPVMVSVGDTPGCSLAEQFEGVDEIRPGNFVFYDLTQWRLGACDFEDVAVAVACPVVALHPEWGRIIVYGGGVHFSRDALAAPESLLELGSKLVFGLVVTLNEGGWIRPAEESWVVSLSQEHGVVQAGPGLLDSVRVGDVLGVLPVHSCLTADLLRQYLTMEGEVIECIRRGRIGG